MSTRRLISGPVYLPTGGVNFDSNALTIAENECNSILNLRIAPHEIKTRGGSRRIASNVPSGDPILHFHTYKVPNGGEETFAFTGRDVYRLTQSNGSWARATKKVVIDSCEATINFSTGLTGSVSNQTSTPYEGSKYLRVALTTPQNVTSSSVVLEKSGLNLDLSEYTHASFWWKAIAIGVDVGMEIVFYSDVDLTTAIETFTLPTSTSGSEVDWEEVLLTFTTPANWTSVRGFRIKFTGSATFPPPPPTYTVPTQFQYDYFTAFVRASSTAVEFWSTCDIVDSTYGSTVVAAGSNPPNITDAEDDGASRVLLYYDKDMGYFKAVSQRVSANSEQLAIHNGSGVSPGPFSGTLAQTNIVPFTLFFLSGSFRIFDNGSGILTGDGSGTIDYATGAYSVTFSSNVGVVNTNYNYYSSVTRLPRYVANFNSRLFMGSIYEDSTYYPWRTRWSNVADIRTVTGTSYKDLVEDDISPISAFSKTGEYLVIYRQQSVVKVRIIGGTSVFGFYTIWHYGTFAGKTVIEWNNSNFVLGFDDVYLFDGNSFTSISTQRVREHLFRTLNTNKIQNCFASFNETFKEYWLWVVEPNETYPTKVYVYNVLYNTWTLFEYLPTTAVGRYYTVRGTTIDELVGTIDQQNWTLDSGLLEGTVRTPIFALYQGDVYASDELLSRDYVNTSSGAATDIPFHLITRDFIFADLGRKDRSQRIHFEAYGDEVTVGNHTGYSKDLNEFQDKDVITLSPAHEEAQYWPDKVGEHIRFSFEGVNLFSLRWINPFAIVQEKD